MNEIVCIITSDVSDKELIKTVIEELGGHWDDYDINNGGGVSEGEGQGSADVYIYTPDPIFPTDGSYGGYSPERINELTEKLGKPPLSALGITIGHGKGSYELAKKVGIHFVKKWGGIIDLDNTSISLGEFGIELMKFIYYIPTTDSEFSNEELAKTVVEELGGWWDSERYNGVGGGRVENGRATADISAEYPLEKADYDIEEAIQLAEAKGQTLRSVVGISIGREEGSHELAKKVANHFAKKWGGFINLNGTDEPFDVDNM